MRTEKNFSLVVSVSVVLVVLVGLFNARPAYGEPPVSEIASSLWRRIAGRPLLPNDPRRVHVEAHIAAGRVEEAAKIATSDPGFIRITMRSFAEKLSNKENVPTPSLNDFTMMFMLGVHNGWSGVDLLTKEQTFTPNPEVLAYATSTSLQPGSDNFSSTSYKIGFSNDNAYNNTKQVRIPIPDASYLTSQYFDPPARMSTEGMFAVHTMQPAGYSRLPDGRIVSHYVPINQNDREDGRDGDTNATLLVDPQDQAGLLTSRAFGFEAFSAGTNRRFIEFIFQRFLCTQLTEVKDSAVTTKYIRRDVDRAPGGNPLLFQNNCRGCHSSLDAIANAAAHFTTTGSALAHRGDRVDAKVIRGSNSGNEQTYPTGYITQNNKWSYLYNSPAIQARIGWRGATQGQGLKSLGYAVSQSRAFSACMARRVFQHACGRPTSLAEDQDIERLADHFESSNYRIKSLFEKIATSPRCFEL